VKFSFIYTVIVFFLFNTQLVEANNHYPITRDSKITIAKGELLYNQYCVSCHMVNLSGAKNWKNGKDNDGHNLSPPLNGTGHTWHHSDELLHNIVKHGFVNLVKNYKGKMAGFANKINDKQIDSVLSYIKSYWKVEIYERQIKMSKQ